jgi:hypothetical protein
MRLREWQQALGAALRDPAAPTPPVHTRGLTAARRVAVYRNNSFVAQHGALAAIYPVTERLLGTECFAALAHHYLAAHPPRWADLRRLGRHLPGFCARRAEFAALPYLHDVARLERARHRAFHARDVPVLTAAALADVDPDTLRLRAHPASALVVSRYPLRAIWEANQVGADGRADLRAGAQRVLVTRPGIEVQIRGLARTDATFARTLLHGATVPDAIACALRVDATFDPAASLPALIAAGAFMSSPDP